MPAAYDATAVLAARNTQGSGEGRRETACGRTPAIGCRSVDPPHSVTKGGEEGIVSSPLLVGCRQSLVDHASTAASSGWVDTIGNMIEIGWSLATAVGAESWVRSSA
jgi:hypothetical protein